MHKVDRQRSKIQLMEKRNGEKFVVNKAFTESYRRLAIPNMQTRNLTQKEKRKRIDNSVQVNYDFF